MKRFTIVERVAAGDCCAFERPFALALGNMVTPESETTLLVSHHIRWADGGETTPSKLVMLYRFHHRQIHEDQADVSILGALHAGRWHC